MTAEIEPMDRDDSTGEERTSETQETPERVHLTRWFRQRPTSLEFWDAVVTDDSLVWCFLGESFKSLLLRADVSEYSRKEVENCANDGLPELSEQNISVPLSALQRIELDTGARFRRSKLTVTWEQTDGDGTVTWELYGTSDSDPQVELVESLAADDRFSHVDVHIHRRSGLL
ncbi:hypothetical protein C499_15470 [Halogeometricum borinquense DSM 11551]|uniref:Uncharacterized protein n=1 Tax=Halogeometricum borinquense (strain ATCC 700274 / DSM 11551 / JCM 10706 / KCTC 4070 / PR3) TaxID=469382 RepID=E4NSQ3_HALBP|nr:hypothetical protein [Halogeometricum borinquense]ADQ68146.1 hypothetical protein Hbor_25930 [Halogeometricum borinquense DSM 11551]ELY24810.1 hypothetical protein C499_15470 [Halogeometricum borinquense DSM 11551]